ncbi:MAG: hypothetical protein JWO52_1578, partial [Gammaproteobacteria bacterium]|nr:hypothetical protein [Gammaproteobacteria bacterium]
MITTTGMRLAAALISLALRVPLRPHLARNANVMSLQHSAALWLLTTLSLLSSTNALATQYLYDAAGRMVAAIAADGSAAAYRYDSVGNILGIQRLAPGQLSVLALTSAQGSVGGTITIEGTGFSTNPSNDVVTINGVTATVVSATATQLVVQVPSGATTGQVSVTVGSNTASSSQNFVLVPGPTITSFSPGVVDAGGTVTVTGTNLNPLPGGTSFRVANNPVAANSLSSTQAAIIAAQTGSGPIQVATPYGQATTTSDLIVAPNGIAAANIVATSASPLGSSDQTLTVNQANKYGVMEFYGTAGQFLSIQLSSLTTSPSGATLSYQVYSPANASIASGSASATTPSIHLPVVTTSGAYIVAFTSSTATFQLAAHLEVNSGVAPDGASLNLATSAPAQSKRFIFSAASGDNVGLGIASLVKTNGSSTYPYMNVSVYTPTGATWGSGQCYPSNGGCDVVLSNAPVNGVYSVLVQSPSPSAEPNLTMSFTTTLSHDVVVPLTADTAASMGLSRNGQHGRFTFTGTAGGSAGIEIGGISTTPAGRTVSLTVIRPDGASLTSASTSSGYSFD